MVNLLKLRDNFKKELENVASGKASSLSFLKTILPPESNRPKDYQVMVMGGTNFSMANVKRNGWEIELLDVKKEKFEPFESLNKFYEFISDRIDPEIDTVCLNFAFPLQSICRENRLDGVFLRDTKEHNFSDLEGKNVGESIEKYVEEKGRKIKFSVANDITCLLLSGLLVTDKKNLVALIVGTGFNMGIFENSYAVNLEAGNFDKFIQSDESRQIDKLSKNPNENLFEKEVAGAYLYKHFNYRLKEECIDFEPITSSQKLYELAFGNIEDKIIEEMAKGVFEHSAQFIAASLSGVALYKKSNIEVIIQGGILTSEYKEMLLNYFEKLSSYKIRFYKIENSSRLGAAYLI